VSAKEGLGEREFKSTMAYIYIYIERERSERGKSERVKRGREREEQSQMNIPRRRHLEEVIRSRSSWGITRHLMSLRFK